MCNLLFLPPQSKSLAIKPRAHSITITMQALSSLYVVKSGSKRSRENIAVYQFKIDVGISIELAKLNYKTRKTKEFVKVFLHLMLLSVMHVIS